jgi:serine/threonine protein phosphatase PrpC
VLMNHPMRNALTNVVGAGTRTDVHVVEEPVSAGDVLLMTTDGVHGVIDDGQLEQLMTIGDDLEAIAANVIAAALARGSRDNVTAIVARIDRDNR